MVVIVGSACSPRTSHQSQFPCRRRGKLADGRNNFGLWRSALGRHSQEETELRKGDSSEPFKQRRIYEHWRDWNWRYWCSDCQKVRHPRGAGGLVSGAASKAVVPLVKASRQWRAFVDEFRSCRCYHPRTLVRGCICALAPTQSPLWTLRIHGPRVLAREIPLFATQAGHRYGALPF